jgi:hypothetical protein
MKLRDTLLCAEPLPTPELEDGVRRSRGFLSGMVLDVSCAGGTASPAMREQFGD